MLTFIDTNKLPRKKAAIGEYRGTEPGALRRQECGGGIALAEIRGEIQSGSSDKHPASLPDGRERKHPPRQQELLMFQKAQVSISAPRKRDIQPEGGSFVEALTSGRSQKSRRSEWPQPRRAFRKVTLRRVIPARLSGKMG